MKTATKKTLLVLLVTLLACSLLTCFASAASEGSSAGTAFDFEAVMKDFDPYFNLFKDMTLDVDAFLTGSLGNTFTIAVIVLAIVGLIECLFGYSLLKLEVFLAGFAGGGYLGIFLFGIPQIADIFTPILTEAWMYYLIYAVLGLLVAYLAFKLMRLAIFLMVGFSVYLFLGSTVAAELAKIEGLPVLFDMPELLPILLTAVIGILVGLLALKLVRAIITLSTSLWGAATFTFALAGFLPEFDSRNLIITAVLFVVGVAVQFARRSRN